MSDWPIDGPGFEDRVEVHEPGEEVLTGYVTEWTSERYFGGPFYTVNTANDVAYEVRPEHIRVVR